MTHLTAPSISKLTMNSIATSPAPTYQASCSAVQVTNQR